MIDTHNHSSLTGTIWGSQHYYPRFSCKTLRHREGNTLSLVTYSQRPKQWYLPLHTRLALMWLLVSLRACLPFSSNPMLSMQTYLVPWTCNDTSYQKFSSLTPLCLDVSPISFHKYSMVFSATGPVTWTINYLSISFKVNVYRGNWFLIVLSSLLIESENLSVSIPKINVCQLFRRKKFYETPSYIR